MVKRDNMSYYGFKSYENLIIKEVIDNSVKTPIELIKSFSPVSEENMDTVNTVSSCEMFFSEEAYVYKIYWGLIIFYLTKYDNFEIENKWLNIALLLYDHLEKEIMEDEFFNKSWLSTYKRKSELDNEKNIILNKIKNNEIKSKSLELNVHVQ